MMGVRIVHMRMAQWRMGMLVRVWLCYRGIVPMLMVHIVTMAVLMIQFQMRMFVDMAFGQMDPEADSHKNAGQDEAIRQRVAKQHERQYCADKWRQREVCACPCSAEVAQGKNEKNEAHANGHESDKGREGNHWQGRELRT